MDFKLNAKQLRLLESGDANVSKSFSTSQLKPRYPVYLILDNVYDTYNIGGLFRLSDALNISKLYICGQSETPPNHKIRKASIGTYKVVPWAYKKTTRKAIDELRRDHPLVHVVAIEQAKSSIPYTQFAWEKFASNDRPVALVVGHETNGVAPEVLTICDSIVEIPMHGVNFSLNVIVSAAIVMYHMYDRARFEAAINSAMGVDKTKEKSV